VREPANAGFVTAESEALVEAGVELTLQLADCPVLLVGFDLIEAALACVFDAEEEDVVLPTQSERAQRRWLHFSSFYLYLTDGRWLV